MTFFYLKRYRGGDTYCVVAICPNYTLFKRELLCRMEFNRGYGFRYMEIPSNCVYRVYGKQEWFNIQDYPELWPLPCPKELE